MKEERKKKMNGGRPGPIGQEAQDCLDPKVAVVVTMVRTTGPGPFMSIKHKKTD